MVDLSEFLTLHGMVSLLTLSLLEIILGIDNIIFIAIIATKLPKNLQAKARAIGLTLALVFRVGLLFAISWIIGLHEALFYLADFGVTGRDLILFTGGIFLIIKTIKEINEKINHAEAPPGTSHATTLRGAILQIVFIDIVFSFDSILTAVGLVNNVLLMVAAVIIAMFFMLASSAWVSAFINKHPTIKMLALAFLVMIGLVLVLESLHIHVEKAFVYVALTFSIGVELLNMAYRSRAHKRERQ